MKLRIQKEQLEHLGKLFNIEKGSTYQMLGYEINFSTGNIHDKLDQNTRHNDADIQVIAVLLLHYLLGKPILKTGKLIKFKDLQGGYAYERAFIQRAVQPIAHEFGENPAELLEAANLLNGKPLVLGDASVEIPTLEGLSLVYILWGKHEFPANASVLYDESASSYLPTEDLAIIAELTTSRLIKAKAALKLKKPES